MDHTDVLEAQQQTAKLVFPREEVANRSETLLEDHMTMRFF